MEVDLDYLINSNAISNDIPWHTLNAVQLMQNAINRAAKAVMMSILTSTEHKFYDLLLVYACFMF